MKTNIFENAAIRNATVLSVSTKHEDCESLERIFQEAGWATYKTPEWTVLSSATQISALTLLRNVQISIILYDSAMSPATWREMLEFISLLALVPKGETTS